MAAYFNGFSCVGLATKKLDKKKGHVPTNNENTNIKSLSYLCNYLKISLNSTLIKIEGRIKNSKLVQKC